MEQKKSRKANLENKRTVFLEVGFIVALALVFFAFEYKSYDKIEYTDVERIVDDTQEEMIPITEQKVKPPELKPPPQVTIINVVDDDVDVVEDIEIDMVFDEDVAMEEYQYVEEDEEIEEDHIFLILEDNPEFIGGDVAMYRFIGDNIDYPRMAKEAGISGRVFVVFVVERDGSVTDVRVMRGIGGGCDEEAIRVIKAMPKWKPGKQRGRAVRCQYRMPIKFTLQ